MLLLALDTATQLCGVAVVRLAEASGSPAPAGQAVVRQARVTTHSGTLLTLVDEALRAFGARPRDLGAVVCSAGPGSFTGLRIGAATAKGLCFALDLPLVFVSALDTLAEPHENKPGAPTYVLGCIDAWQGQVYARLYAANQEAARDDLPASLFAERAWSPDDLADAVTPLAQGLLLCGDGALRYPRLRDLNSLHDTELYPHPLALARLGGRRLQVGERDDLGSASPNYICPPAIHVKPEPAS